MTSKNNYGEKLLEPFQEFDRCHLTEYSIQLSLYALILKEIGLDVNVFYLVYIGPNEEAQLHKCHNFTQILFDYLERANDIDKELFG